VSRFLLTALAAALPVAGSLATIAVREADLRDATEWRIPIAGYDPRDPLRGRYITFQYVWRFEGDRKACGDGDDCRLCLEDGGARVLVRPQGASCAAPVDLAVSELRVGGGFGSEADRLTATTRLWVSASRAPVLERQLRAGPMIAVARLTGSGRLIPIRLEAGR
jgi:hypothetical protein